VGQIFDSRLINRSHYIYTMQKFDYILRKARHSLFYRYLFSLMLGRIIPFNRTHRFRVLALDEHSMSILLPYRRSNHNHLGGIHACALATLAELTSGLVLLMTTDSRRYRLILQKLHMEYHYQARQDVVARFEARPAWLAETVEPHLAKDQKVTIPCTIALHDREGHHVATGEVHWQLKDWRAVKTKS